MSSTFQSFLRYAAVTPSDVTKLDFHALYVGVAGDVVVENIAGSTVTFTAVPVGILWIRGVKVLSTGTTATNIVWGSW